MLLSQFQIFTYNYCGLLYVDYWWHLYKGAGPFPIKAVDKPKLTMRENQLLLKFQVFVNSCLNFKLL